MIKTCQVCLIQTTCQKCSRCEVACYCSVQCQRSDWPEHKLVCCALEHGNAIADNYLKQGYFEKAEKMLLKEEHVIEEGNNSILVEINKKMTLACTYMEQNKFVSAVDLLRTCLSSLRECDAQGFADAKTLMTSALCNIGACLNNQEKCADAIVYFKEARELNKFVMNQLPGTKQTKFLVNNFFVSTYNLCIALEATGRHEEALKMLTTVIDDMKVEYGDKSPELILPMFIFAGFCQRRRIKDFKRINKETVQLAKEVLGSNHLQYLKYIVSSSQNTKYKMFAPGEEMDFSLFDEWNEARDVLKETLKKLTRRLGKNHNLTIDCKFELARVLVEKAHFKRAEKLIKECVHYWRTSLKNPENDYKKQIRFAINLLLHLDQEWYTIKIQYHAFNRLRKKEVITEEVINHNFGDDRKRTNRGYIIDEESLFSYERDVNEDDGYILKQKTVDLFVDKDDRSLDDHSLDDHSLEGSDKSNNSNIEVGDKSNNSNVEGDDNSEKKV